VLGTIDWAFLVKVFLKSKLKFSLLGAGHKDVRTLEEGVCQMWIREEGGSSNVNVPIFLCKNFKFFAVCGVSARTRGGWASAYSGEGSIFRNFVRTASNGVEVACCSIRAFRSQSVASGSVPRQV